MKVLHVSAECYPAAKAGGLGDVVGALPKYLNQAGLEAGVIIPKYNQKWILNQPWELLYSSVVRMAGVQVPFYIKKNIGEDLGFELLTADIPGLFDREGIYTDNFTGYGYADETERYIVFQQAVLQFVQQLPGFVDVLHCHDHHAGLIPFMVKHCPEYRNLAHIPTVFTIHNGMYHGAFSWSKAYLLPWYDANSNGLLEWGNTINPLASGIKCCWQFTTVSPGYLMELLQAANGLEWLIRNEMPKATGIINGIDTDIWNPEKDPFISFKLNEGINEFKQENKNLLMNRFNVRNELPLITFIGRLVGEKGADLLPEAIARFLYEGGKASFVVLGTGDPSLKEAFIKLKHQFISYFDTSIEYNETLSHQLYAGSDFLVMPSRVEPCGLNQLYAFRYATVPIVRTTGGLADTVKDISSGNGTGIRFDDFSVEALIGAFKRAALVYERKDLLQELRENIIQLDYSWAVSAKKYIGIYKKLIRE